ncbi:MAG: tetratricopeptide repeat protein [Victivallales bacterium]|nr:tetratricopeptide repeat protein [Victivallales bacterium]
MNCVRKTVCATLLFAWGLAATAVESNSGNFNIYYRSGLEKFRSRDYPGALEQLEKAAAAAKSSETRIKVLFAIADVYSAQGNYQDAGKYLMRIFAVPKLTRPDRISAYRRLLLLSKRRQDYEEALDTLASAFRDPALSDVRWLFLRERAQLYAGQKKYAEAERNLRESLDLCGKDSPRRHELQREIVIILHQQKKYQAALDYLAELKIAAWDEHSQRLACYYGGLCAVRLGNYRLAADWFNRMPSGAAAWLQYSCNTQLADCYSQLQETEKAYACLDSLWRDAQLPAYYRGNALWLMAELRYRRKQYSEAKTLCEKLMKFPGLTERQSERAQNLLRSIAAPEK